MAKWFTALGLFVCVVTTLGCSSQAGPQVASLTKVSGTVQMDGKPMPEGEIAFSVPGGGPVILKIKAGAFEGRVSAGEKRVEIRAYRPGEPVMMDGKPSGDPVQVNYIPDQYNVNSTLKATIGASGTADLKFEITSI